MRNPTIEMFVGDAEIERRERSATDAAAEVDLVAKGPNRKWNDRLKAPELFEQWWTKHGDNSWSVKHAAQEAWYACAESLGVYDDK